MQEHSSRNTSSIALLFYSENGEKVSRKLSSQSDSSCGWINNCYWICVCSSSHFWREVNMKFWIWISSYISGWLDPSSSSAPAWSFRSSLSCTYSSLAENLVWNTVLYFNQNWIYLPWFLPIKNVRPKQRFFPLFRSATPSSPLWSSLYSAAWPIPRYASLKMHRVE